MSGWKAGCRILGAAVCLTVLGGALLSSQQPVLRSNHVRGILGTTLDWINDGDGLRLSVSQPDAPAESLINTLGYRVVRIPGGYLARTFDWQLALGGSRGTARDFSGRLQPILTGLPEFKRYAARNLLQVMYTLNMADPPEKASGLVRAWNALEPRSGPELQFFELGNEEYDRGPDDSHARRYVSTAESLLAVIRHDAPRALVGAVLSNPRAESWDSVVVVSLADRVDFLIWHRYVPYIPYTGPESYGPTLSAFQQVDSELAAQRRLLSGRSVPILLGEYNLSYYDSSHVHQNVVLPPRFYLLLGNFLYLAVKHELAGLMKCCVVNAGWHTFADVNFSGGMTAQLSYSGMTTRLLQQWLAAQDSVGIVEQRGVNPLHLSVIAGKRSDGLVSYLVQNHDSLSQRIQIDIPPGNEPSSQAGLMDHEGQGWTVPDRPYVTDANGGVTLPPYSLMVLRLRAAR